MICRWATLHWIRFAGIETPGRLDLSRQPEGAARWKIGPIGAPESAGCDLTLQRRLRAHGASPTTCGPCS